MRDNTKLGIGIVGAVIFAVILYWRFSPYEQCVRATTEENYQNRLTSDDSPDPWAKAERRAKIFCAHN